MINNNQITNFNTTPINSTNQDFFGDIQKALELLKIVKKQDSTNTQKELESLLIDYILANMKGDWADSKSIQAQIAQVMQSYGKDMHQAGKIEAELKAMEANPSGSAKDLAYLQSLLAALQQDAGSGDMSNLYQF